MKAGSEIHHLAVEERPEVAATAEAAAGVRHGKKHKEREHPEAGGAREVMPRLCAEALRKELDDTRDRLLRLQADFENFRRRTLREKGEVYVRANMDLVQELLPVLDHVDLAVAASGEHGVNPAFLKGLRLLGEQLSGALGKFGLAAVAVGTEPLDPALHEAVSYQPSTEAPQGVILAQVRKGYRLGDRLLRPAQVVVSSGPPAAPASGAAPQDPARETGEE